ncbi:acyl-homoserine lactone acylase PvdQ [Cellulomonas sp. URHB0016]
MRRPSPSADRRLPLDAWSAAARPEAWQVLPAAVEVTDVAVDANERPDGRSPDLGTGYPSSSRADRIAELLAARAEQPLTPEDMTTIHADTDLATAAPLLGRLAALDGLTPAADDARSRMLAWDRRMDAASPDAALFARWRAAVVARLASHPDLAPLHRPHGDGALFDPWFSVAGRVTDALPRLLDVPALDPDEVLRAAWEEAALAVDQAVADAEHAGTDGSADGRTGSTREPARWGDVHRLRPVHVLDAVPGVDAPAVPGVPLGGDADCVRSTTGLPWFGGDVFRGSVARWVWDLDDRRGSRWGVPFGASGDPAGPHFADQLGDWAAARTVPVVTGWELLRPHPWPTPVAPGARGSA